MDKNHGSGKTKTMTAANTGAIPLYRICKGLSKEFPQKIRGCTGYADTTVQFCSKGIQCT